MKKYILISIVLLSVLNACEQNVDLEVPKGDDMIVVHGGFHVDSTFAIRLTQSQYVLSNNWDIKYLNNATVKLFKNGEFVENLLYTPNGLYYSPTLQLDYESEYSIEASAEGLKTAKAHTRIPAPVNIESASAVQKMEYGYHVTLKFTDPAATNNYYLIEGHYQQEYDVWDEATQSIVKRTFRTKIWFENNDENIMGGNDNVVEEGWLISDELFNGKGYQASFDFSLWVPTTTVVYFNLNSITREHYLFLRSKQLQDNASENPFAEPVQVYNNIEGGLGIFSGMSSSIYSFEVQASK